MRLATFLTMLCAVIFLTGTFIPAASAATVHSDNFNTHTGSLNDGNEHHGYWFEGADSGATAGFVNGRLLVDATGANEEATVWLNKVLTGDVRIEFDAHIEASPGNINNINSYLLFSDKTGASLYSTRARRSDGDIDEYGGGTNANAPLRGYIITHVGSGTPNNPRYRLRDVPPHNPVLHQVNDVVHARQGHTYHIIIEKTGNRIKYTVDGTLIFNVADTGGNNPVHNSGLFGFRTFETRLWWDNLVITDGDTEPTPSAPTLTLTANPATITQGNSSVLAWTSTGATSCTASGGWTGVKAISGSQSVAPTQTTTYTLACTGAGGAITKNVTVSVESAQPLPNLFPSLTLTASRLSVPRGQSLTLSWISANMTSCTATGGWTGAKAIQGTETITPSFTSTYTLTCTGNFGTISRTASVTVTEPAIMSRLCTRYGSGDPAPTSYGLAWNWLATARTLILSLTCTGSTLDATIGSPNTSLPTSRRGLVYSWGKVYAYTGASWNISQPVPLTCNGTKIPVADVTPTDGLPDFWCNGTLTGTLPGSATFFVGYTCIYDGANWKCGCTDAACTRSGWQLQGKGSNE